MIHVSDVVKTADCGRFALYSHQNPSAVYNFVGASEFKNLWKKWLKLENAPEGKSWDSNEDSLALLSQHKGGLQLRFEREGVRTKIPALVENEDGTYTAWYPVMSSAPRQNLLMQMLLNNWTAKAAGIEITDNRVLALNRGYVRGKTLDEQGILVEREFLAKNNGGWMKTNVNESLAELAQTTNIEELIEKTKKIFEGGEPVEARRNPLCAGKRKCPWFEECFSSQALPDCSIAHLSSSRWREWMEAQGIGRLANACVDKIEGLPMQYAQIMADRNGGVWADLPAMKAFLKSIEWPVSYLDFEWDTYAIPPYEGMMPFDVLCFQYSLHIERNEKEADDNSKLEHVSYFSTGDCRRDFVESLLENIPETGSILVFNAKGGEKLRLSQLARQFPEYAAQLQALQDRMVDLSVPFEHGYYYDIRQRGHFSLKTLLPIFSGQADYSSLAVKDGLQAVEAYRKILLHPELQASLSRNISEYCAMDTYAERELLMGLKKSLKQLENGELPYTNTEELSMLPKDSAAQTAETAKPAPETSAESEEKKTQPAGQSPEPAAA